MCQYRHASDRWRCWTAAPLHRMGNTWPLGIQRGSGGTERVIGLRSSVLPPDWRGTRERQGGEKGKSRELQQLSVRSVPADSAGKSHIHMNTHTPGWDVTATGRNTACSCWIFTCQRDNGRGQAGGRPGHAAQLGHSASLRAQFRVRSRR